MRWDPEYARGEIRTRTGLPPADFESAASAVPPLGRAGKIYRAPPAWPPIYRLDRVLHSAVHYPGDYGFLPRTPTGDPYSEGLSDLGVILSEAKEAMAALRLLRLRSG